MTNETREIVIPGQPLGDIKDNKPGKGTFVENGKIYAEFLGVLNKNQNFVNVVPLKGIYSPSEADFVIGVVEEALGSGWLVNVNAPYPAFLHVNEVPWDVEFGETEKYLNKGDTVMAKISQVDSDKKLQVSLKDRGLYKVKNGYVIEVEPSKVPRIIGKKGSMISLLKKYSRCRIFVGQNGRILIDGDEQGIETVLKAVNMIEEQSLSYGLTNKIDEMLKKETKDVQ